MGHGKDIMAKDIVQARNASEAKRLGKRVIAIRVLGNKQFDLITDNTQ